MSDVAKKTVLLVDDEIFARDYMAQMIEKQGFRVLSATTGEEGIRIFREERPDFVFLDILLPGIDGEYVFKYIRDIDPRARVYFITGCGDSVISPDQAREMGASGFLAKPVFLRDVLKLTDLLKGGGQHDFYSSPEVRQ